MPEQDKKWGKYPKNALIDDVAKDFLDDDNLKNLLDFHEFLKNNKLTPRRQSSAKWVVKHKGNKVCNLMLNVKEPSWSPALENCTIDGWRFSFQQHIAVNGFDSLEEKIADENMTQFILDHIQKPRCGPGPCYNRAAKVLGKEFHPVCFCEMFGITNPSGDELKYLRKLILLIKDIYFI